MNATETLRKINEVYQQHKEVVMKEVETLDAATALMKKWDESRLNDAIYRETKHRAAAVLNAIFPVR